MKMLKHLYSLRKRYRQAGNEVSRVIVPEDDFKHLEKESNLPHYDGSLLMDGTPIVSGDVDEPTVKTEGFIQF